MIGIVGPILIIFYSNRRSGRLRRPRVLREPRLPKEPAVPHGAPTHRNPPQETASIAHGVLFRTDEVHHRGQGPPELRPAGWIQRKVGF